MPITKEEQKLAQETVELLQQCVDKIDLTKPVRISPKRMDAFHKASRLRMTVNIGGYAIQLVEDRHAPTLEKAIAENMPGPEPVPEPPSLLRGPPCSECGGSTVLLEDGDTMCVRCRCVQTADGKPWGNVRTLPSDSPEPPAAETPSNVVLASERAAQDKVH